MKTLRLLNMLGLATFAMLATTSCESGNQEFDYEGETTFTIPNLAMFVRWNSAKTRR